MAERGVEAERGEPGRWRWPSPGTTAFTGVTIFVSGFFVLAATGGSYPPATHALILLGACIVAAPVGALSFLVAASESWLGRAWGAGFRRLEHMERRRPATVQRALRYAGVLWLANGGALWVATLAGGM